MNIPQIEKNIQEHLLWFTEKMAEYPSVDFEGNLTDLMVALDPIFNEIKRRMLNKIFVAGYLEENFMEEYWKIP